MPPLGVESHGAPFKNVTLDGVIDPKRTIHIAIRDPAGEFEQFAYETGMTVIDIDRFYSLGVDGVVAEARRIIGDGPAYISFDVDALDPAFAPGTGTPVVGGISNLRSQETAPRPAWAADHWRGCRRGVASFRPGRHHGTRRRADDV